jgi:2'-5' RNA ligase
VTRANTHVGTLNYTPRPTSEYRYGIFIRPPAEVALPALEMMRTARDLFGFHAATAYPPHITMIGSIVLTGTEVQLIDAVDGVLAGRAAIPTHGTGLNAAIGAAIGIDYNHTSSGEQNLQLVELYEDLRRETEQLRGFEPTDRKAAERRAKVGAEHFRAHLTVLGHDGIDNSSARAEARDVLDHLVKDLPEDWTADTITIYRFWSADWDAKYWLTQEWIPIASWHLVG